MPRGVRGYEPRRRILTFVATSLLTTACQKTETPPEGGAGPAKVPNTEPADKPADKTGDKPADPTPEAKPEPLRGWFDYTGPEGSYTAKFPAKPQENTETMPVEGLPPQTMRSALYEGAGGTKAFITAVVDVNAPAGTTYDVPAGLKGAVEGMLSGMNATQDSTKDMNIGAALGREVMFHGSMDGVNFKGVARVYALGGEKPRLFQANTLVVGADVTDRDAALPRQLQAEHPGRGRGRGHEGRRAGGRRGRVGRARRRRLQGEVPGQARGAGVADADPHRRA